MLAAHPMQGVASQAGLSSDVEGPRMQVAACTLCGQLACACCSPERYGDLASDARVNARLATGTAAAHLC